MTLLNSTWRCHCGVEQDGEPTSYTAALAGLRLHQSEGLCTKQRAGPGDRIHSKRPEPVSEIYKQIDKTPALQLHGPPRPPAQRTRRAREGLPWLPGN